MKLKAFAGIVVCLMVFSFTIVETADGAGRVRMGTSATAPAAAPTAAERGTALDPPCPPEDRVYGFPPRDPAFDDPLDDNAFGIPPEDPAFGILPRGPAFGIPRPDVFGGCCQKPGPDGLHCCDTRDCGWFDCGDDAVRRHRKIFK